MTAFLFRPHPFIVRTKMCQHELDRMVAKGMPLGAFVRAGVEAEIKSNLDDPLVTLQTFVEAALPKNRIIREHTKRLDDAIIDLWANLYQRVFPAYGLQLRDGVEWRDLAKTFTVVAHGLLMRARLRDDGDMDRLSDNVDVLSAVIIGMMPTHYEITVQEIESRELQYPIPGTSA